MHLNIVWCILFTIFTPTCCSRYFGHLKVIIVITVRQLLLTMSSSRHNNYNYTILAKVI